MKCDTTINYCGKCKSIYINWFQICSDRSRAIFFYNENYFVTQTAKFDTRTSITISFVISVHKTNCRPRWSSGYHTRLWIRGSRIRSLPGLMDFFHSVKILSMTSFGREVKPWVPCRRFTTR